MTIVGRSLILADNMCHVTYFADGYLYYGYPGGEPSREGASV
ncbi:MAG: hypothetical protein V3U63_11320 [Gemmatimonadota bacterium]